MFVGFVGLVVLLFYNGGFGALDLFFFLEGPVLLASTWFFRAFSRVVVVFISSCRTLTALCRVFNWVSTRSSLGLSSKIESSTSSSVLYSSRYFGVICRCLFNFL